MAVNAGLEVAAGSTVAVKRPAAKVVGCGIEAAKGGDKGFHLESSRYGAGGGGVNEKEVSCIVGASARRGGGATLGFYNCATWESFGLAGGRTPSGRKGIINSMAVAVDKKAGIVAPLFGVCLCLVGGVFFGFGCGCIHVGG